MATIESLGSRLAVVPDADAVIRVKDLHKSYGSYAAVRGIDLTVGKGEVFAFLGPNGAGKTTTVEMLEGYRHRTSGVVDVLGEDPAHPSLAWRARIGLVLQTSKMPPELTVRELVARHARYYPSPRAVDETIDVVGLTDKRDVRSGRLSGGQLRRLDVALALVGDPVLVFLDEPTTGFDPAARRQAWGLITNLRALGKTVFLTTHYMDEAEFLADRVAVIVGGRIVAEGTPATLGGRDGAPCTIRFRRPADPGCPLPAGTRAEDDMIVLHAAEPVQVLAPIFSWAAERHIELPGLEVHRPTLEDVYLALTGEAS